MNSVEIFPRAYVRIQSTTSTYIFIYHDFHMYMCVFTYIYI